MDRNNFKPTATQIWCLVVLLLGLPLVGVAISGKPIQQHLEFPPRTHYVEHEPFSWWVFVGIGVFNLVIIGPFLLEFLKATTSPNPSLERSGTKNNPPLTKDSLRALPKKFPWWGWLGLLWLIDFWILAWNRFPWFETFQPHTFFPLWLGYILVVNALSYKRSGRCMIFDRFKFFLSLFLISALFWWFFEYLNRFVQNWYYVGNKQYSGWEYFWLATLPFSTVLPAVLGTKELLETLSIWNKAFHNFQPLMFFIGNRSRPCERSQIDSVTGRDRLPAFSKKLEILLLIASTMALASLSIWPNYLFPLVWISPLFILVSLQTISRKPHIFLDIQTGTWTGIVTSALAGLTCGFFWEMWNYQSQAKWIYAIPYVDRFHIFEMPLLGYAGYIPFGVECLAITRIFQDDDG